MEPKTYTLSDFDFHLPQELLALHPARQRDGSRLLIVSRKNQTISHHKFSEIINFFNSGDLLVLNNTKVIPAKMYARKEHLHKGALIDVLLIREATSVMPAWVMYLDPLKKLKPGNKLLFGNGMLQGVYTGRLGELECLVEFPGVTDSISLRKKLFEIGTTPLPPYIKRKTDATDAERYQTIYASSEGALAAPTAGLHFTPELLDAISRKGVRLAHVTLHVGAGTFNSIHEENLDLVKLHSERYVVSEEAARQINGVDKSRALLCAVGTTSLRTLETLSGLDGSIRAGEGQSSIFIKPPYNFGTANALLTNFHTPRSSLLMMISAYMGYDFTMHVYQEAIRNQYRFFSFGDAMLILP